MSLFDPCSIFLCAFPSILKPEKCVILVTGHLLMTLYWLFKVWSFKRQTLLHISQFWCSWRVLVIRQLDQRKWSVGESLTLTHTSATTSFTDWFQTSGVCYRGEDPPVDNSAPLWVTSSTTVSPHLATAAVTLSESNLALLFTAVVLKPFYTMDHKLTHIRPQTPTGPNSIFCSVLACLCCCLAVLVASATLTCL